MGMKHASIHFIMCIQYASPDEKHQHTTIITGRQSVHVMNE